MTMLLIIIANLLLLQIVVKVLACEAFRSGYAVLKPLTTCPLAYRRRVQASPPEGRFSQELVGSARRQRRANRPFQSAEFLDQGVSNIRGNQMNLGGAFASETPLWLAAFFQRPGAVDLTKNSSSIKAPAFELSFKQVSHFSREFKRYYGLPPAGFLDGFEPLPPHNGGAVATNIRGR